MVTTAVALTADYLRSEIDGGRVRLSAGAVWRSDRNNDDQLRFDGYQPFPASFAGHGRHPQHRERIGPLGHRRDHRQNRLG